MKRLKIFFVIVFMLMTFHVKADGLNYYLGYTDNSVNTKNIERGGYFYVSSFIDNKEGTNYHLKSGKVTIRWESDYVELVEISSGNYYEKADFPSVSASKELFSNRMVINYTLDETIGSGKKKLFNFKFRVKTDAKAENTKVYEVDGEDTLTCIKDEVPFTCAYNSYSESNVAILKSKVNLLSNIKIDGTTINGFNENTKSYNITTEKESINIEVTKKDTRSSVSGDIGTKKIAYGVNVFKIKVTSESGAINEYTLYVTREDKRSSINTLNTLELSNGTINFKNNVTEYNVEVDNDVDKITITSSLTDPKSKYEIDYRNKEINLSEGLNKIQIKVIAENETTKTYTLNIVRKLSSNTSLKELKVNDDKIELKEGEFYYNYTVENEIEKVNIKAKSTDEKARVQIENNNELVIGDNEIKINVTAPDGSKAIYYLVVTRKNILSNNSSLKDINITGYQLNFNKDTKYYDLRIKDEDSLDIKVLMEDEKSKVDIEGNKNLINGSIIKITVRAEDNSITRYFINIEKDSKLNIPLIIILGIIILVPIVCITILIIKKYKKNKNQFKELEEKKENVIDKPIEESKENVIEETNDNIEKQQSDKEKVAIDENEKDN